MINFDIPVWTTVEERACLAQLAKEVPDDGLILEIGCLYGGTTCVLAAANTNANIVSMDNFSWTPEGYPKATKDLFLQNMKSVDAKNVTVIEGDSTELWRHWNKDIDLLWIDGGHSYQYVYSDLSNFSKHAKVIALHDYKNPAWDTIETAIKDFLSTHNEWYIANIVGMVCVLRMR